MYRPSMWQEADQSHDPESGLLLVRTVYSGVVCPIHHVYLHPSVFGDTLVPHGLLDSGLESGQSGTQDIGMWEWQHEQGMHRNVHVHLGMTFYSSHVWLGHSMFSCCCSHHPSFTPFPLTSFCSLLSRPSAHHSTPSALLSRGFPCTPGHWSVVEMCVARGRGWETWRNWAVWTEQLGGGVAC